MVTRGGSTKNGFSYGLLVVILAWITLNQGVKAQIGTIVPMSGSGLAGSICASDSGAVANGFVLADSERSIYSDGCKYCLKVKGEIVIARNNNAIAIKIFEGDSLEYTMQSNNASGLFEFNLPFNYNYKIVFSKPGYYDKFIVVDTRYPPRVPELNYEVNFSTDMFKTTEDLNVDVFSLPVAQIEYIVKEDGFAIAESYSRAMKNRMDRLISEYRKLQDEANDDLKLAGVR